MKRISILLENVRQAKELLTKLNIDYKTSDEYNKIREMLSGNDGYVFWFCKLYFSNKTSFDELSNIWNIIKTDRPTISKFSKELVKLNTIEDFWDEYFKVKNQSNLRGIYNEFPSQQKSMLSLSNNDDVKLLSSLSEHKSKNLFFKKVSRYHNRKDLLNAINIFLKSDGNTRFDSILDGLEQNNVNVVYSSEENEIIIASVNYNQLRRFAGDTSWCIVPSEYTFNGYMSGILPQQFIIFLTNEIGNMSKIGVTTNVNGYRTAHLKNDSHFSEKSLASLLKSRGTRFGILLPTKESINKFKNFNNIDVGTLLSIGFTKEEIIDRKHRYGVNGVSDLSHFTKEEIEKWGLFDKTELTVGDLKPFSAAEIISRDMLKRLKSVDNSIFAKFVEFGFTYDQIRKLAKNDVFEGDPIAFIISNSTRSKLKEIVKNSLFHGIRLAGKYIDISYSDRPVYRRTLYEIGRFNHDDIDFDTTLNIFESDGRGTTTIKYQIEKIEQLGFDLSGDQLNKIFKKYSTADYIKSLCELINSNCKVEHFMSMITDMKVDSSRYNGDSRLGLDYEEMAHINTLISVKYPELFDRIYDMCRTNHISNRSSLLVKDKDRGGYSREIDATKTLANLTYWKVSDSMDLAKLYDIIKEIKSSKMSDVIKYLKENNYDINSDECFKLLTNLDTYSYDTDGVVDNYIQCVKNGVFVDICFKHIIEYLNSKNSPLDDYKKKKYEEIFKNHDKYQKEWQNYLKSDDVNSAIKHTLESAKTPNTTGSRRTESTIVWYKDRWPLIKEIDWSGFYKRDYRGNILISTIVLLASLDKKSDLDDISIDSFYSDSIISSVCKIIADKEITNWKRTYIELNKDQRKMLYDWLNKQVTAKSVYLDQMPISWYIYDNDKFWRYVEHVTKISNNYTTYVNMGRKNEREVQVTARLIRLNRVITYLVEEGKFDDLEKMFSMFKMNNTEKKHVYNVIYYKNFSYSRYNDKELYNSDADKEYSKRYKEILDKYFKSEKKSTKTNEKFIIGWNQFRKSN